MSRVHDRGGRPGAGPVDKSEHDLSWWEKRTDAIAMLLMSPQKRVMRVDELRRAIESMEPAAYEKSKYYERWLHAVETIMVEKGVLTREEIERKVKELAARR
ncbi:MAG: nitrile hydratase subunit beta [Candidatus Rokubacteria bacterium]|nr:nitrile hydratase subunit beta [Candidatus Rokubacteria bacterium]MBI2554977.1 nitrile hydratase subunit beta [Candidatus Rokubacteria bacterium]